MQATDLARIADGLEPLPAIERIELDKALMDKARRSIERKFELAEDGARL